MYAVSEGHIFYYQFGMETVFVDLFTLTGNYTVDIVDFPLLRIIRRLQTTHHLSMRIITLIFL